MDRKDFLYVEDIERILGFKSSKVYDLINKLNKELEDMGYITFKGRVLVSYFRKRVGLD